MSLRVFHGDVTFENVSFRYPSRPQSPCCTSSPFPPRPAKRSLSVGPSGAGKSTIVSLLLRFYEVDSGRVLVDDKPIGDRTLRDLRANMAIVPQEVLLFGGSIEENIARPAWRRPSRK